MITITWAIKYTSTLITCRLILVLYDLEAINQINTILPITHKILAISLFRYMIHKLQAPTFNTIIRNLGPTFI